MPRRIETQMLIYQRVATQLKAIRKQRHLTYTQIGKMIGVSYQQIQKYEKLQNRIPLEKLYSLSLQLNVPMSYFLGDL